MGEMIQKPDTNPIIVAAANLMGLGGLGYFLMGQQKKAIISVRHLPVIGRSLCGLGYLFAFVTAYDAYLLGQKLQRGEAIGVNENGLDFLNMCSRTDPQGRAARAGAGATRSSAPRLADTAHSHAIAMPRSTPKAGMVAHVRSA